VDRIPMQNGDEMDAFSKRTRKFLTFSRGYLRQIKRRYNKRFRQAGKTLIRQEKHDESNTQ
jgi:hypothetical protein